MNPTLQTIYSLRSIHGNFSDIEVSDEHIHQILDACPHAANASARQSYSIIVVKNRQTIQEHFLYKGNKALLFCVDFNRIIRTARHLQKDFTPDGILAFTTGWTDTVMAAQTAAIAAKSLGIDSLFTNSIHRHKPDSLYQTFRLPREYCFPVIALLLGYPSQEPAYKKGRLKGLGLVHYDKYQELTDPDLDTIISQYDDPANHLGMSDTWQQQGYRHYLEWFHDKWCEKDTTTRQKSLYELLQKTGFLPELS